MIPQSRHIALLAGLVSLSVLLGAWGFQFIGGLAPCPMCLWQRWPHAVATVVALGAFWVGPLILWSLVGGVTMIVSTGLAVYHSGVERDWWDGPNTCTSGDISDLSTQDLMDQIMSAPLVRCDDIVWDLFGITMSNYNALISLALVGLWGVVYVRRCA